MKTAQRLKVAIIIAATLCLRYAVIHVGGRTWTLRTERVLLDELFPSLLPGVPIPTLRRAASPVVIDPELSGGLRWALMLWAAPGGRERRASRECAWTERKVGH